MLLRSTSSMAIIVGLGVLQSAGAIAQDAGGAAEAENKFAEGTIIVTARNREEALQSVPLDITAFSAEAIEDKSIESLEDVARLTPGLTFETLDGAGGAPTIRGATSLTPFNREQTTAVFYDNVYLPRTYLFDATTELLNRVEVVKGPQSSRYGRNAFSGAINYIPKKADLRETSMEGFFTVGLDERFDIGGNVNFIAVPDVLSVFISASHTEFDGSWENSHPFADFGFSPGTNGNVGGRNNESITAGAMFRPVPELTIEVSYLSNEIRDEANATRYHLVNGPDAIGIGNCGPIVNGYFRLLCGDPPTPEDTVIVEPRGFGRQVDSEILRANIAYEVSDGININYLFSRITGESVTGYQSENDPINCGTTLSPSIFEGGVRVCNFQASPLGSVDYTSHELRLDYDNGSGLRLGVGGYYLDGEDINYFITASVPALDLDFPGRFEPLNLIPVSSGPLDPFPFDPAVLSNFVARHTETNTETRAIFGEISYGFNQDRTRVSLEGRYTSEKIGTLNVLAGVPVGNSPQTFKFFTPRFTIEHNVSDDSLLYASAARGAKAGGFNGGAFDPDVAGSFGPEFNWTYEIGSKNQFFDRLLTLNFAAFYTDWTNLQQRVTDPTDPRDNLVQTIIQNVGSVEIYGLEGTAVLEFDNGLTIDSNAAYTISKYGPDTFDLTIVNQGIDPALEGNSLPRVPKFTAALGIQYDGEINEDTSFFVRADGTYQSSQFTDPKNFVTSPSRFLANARMGIDIKNYSIDLWVKNIFDKKYASVSNFIYQRPPSATTHGSIYGDRRTVGVSGRMKF